MKNEEVREVHTQTALSSSKVMELLDQYPNLETITCPKSIHDRIPKKYISALNSLDIDVNIDYKWGHPKKSNVFLKSKVLKLVDEGYSAKEIAKQLDIPLNKVYYLVRNSDSDFKFNNYRRKYSDDKKSMVKSMKEEGKSPKEISNELDIPLRTVYYILNKK